MNNESSTQIGAKALTKAEINLILPSYDRILSQIEEIRNESNLSKENNIQKTNNISVLGVRGSGKTSILKSIINDLEKENNNKNEELNIIFPMIIPENMSEKMNLLSTILGLFKKKVDEIENKNKEKSQNCWEKTTTEVSKKYNSLLKKYCHMQSEFRQVSIDEFISESNYVRKNAEIFNADSEFINDFNKFITEITQKTNTLIFFFIDDIDLSTNRCTDIIKTLLAYMSHPKIVTILSGDLDTFAEELTIDFLKKGDLLHKDLLDISFINNDEKNILERKKELAYEYLKKIIPPIYRHNLKTWSLKNRAQFKSATTIDGKDSDNKNLAELLTDTFRDYDCEALFQYYDFNEEDENKRIKPIPQMFHMFDDTSRGLNNVYNALLQVNKYIKDDNNKKDGDYDTKCFKYIRNFLETVISTNKILNSEATLLNNVISMGSSFEDTIINCEYFDNNVSNDKEIENKIEALKRFALFSFYDFSIRVLRKSELFNNTIYQLNHKSAIINLLRYNEQTKERNIEIFPLSLHSLCFIPKKNEIFANHYLSYLNNDYYYNYSLALISYLKISNKKIHNLLYNSYNQKELFLVSFELLSKEHYNKRFIFVNRLLSIILRKVNISDNFPGKYVITKTDIIKKLCCNYIIENFNNFEEIKINDFINKKNIKNIKNIDDKKIKCILEIDNINCWDSEGIDNINFQVSKKINALKNEIYKTTFNDSPNNFQVKTTGFKNIYNEFIEIIKSEFSGEKNTNMGISNLIAIDKDEITFDEYYYCCHISIKYLHVFNENKNKRIITLNLIKALNNAQLIININEDNFQFWLYTSLKSCTHLFKEYHKYECIADLIDKLYTYFKEDDIFGNNEIENKLSSDTIKTIKEWSTLKNADEEKSEDSPNDNETLEEAGKTQNLNTNTENPSHDINTSKNNNTPQNNEVNETQIYPQSNKKFKSKIKVKKLNNIMNSNLISISLIMKFRKKKAQDTSRTTNESGE